MDLPAPVQYVTTSDGINIAYTVSGDGQPMVFVPNLINHVLLSWQMPQMGPWLRALTGRFRLVRYDSRGMGMSTRGLPDDHAFERYQVDIEAVLERVKLERFVLFAQGSGGQIAVRYAIRHPQNVIALVMLGYSSVRALRAGELIYRTLPEQDWEMFLKTIANANASSADIKPTVEILRQSVTAEDWIASRRGRPEDSRDRIVPSRNACARTPSARFHLPPGRCVHEGRPAQPWPLGNHRWLQQLRQRDPGAARNRGLSGWTSAGRGITASGRFDGA